MTKSVVPDSGSEPRRGRPRSAKARAAILDAAWEILVAKGLRAMTVDAVAERAGVSKATIYRWWDSKAELALETFLIGVEEQVPVPDTGSLAGDLRARMRTTIKAYGGPPLGPILTALIAEAQFDPAFRTALKEFAIGPLRDASREAFRRAEARGEIASPAPADLALDMLVGAVYYRLLLQSGPVNNRLADDSVNLLLAGLQGGGPPSQKQNPGGGLRLNPT